jgi:hypothetical protein
MCTCFAFVGSRQDSDAGALKLLFSSSTMCTQLEIRANVISLYSIIDLTFEHSTNLRVSIVVLVIVSRGDVAFSAVDIPVT